jgi:hypothetical protein
MFLKYFRSNNLSLFFVIPLLVFLVRLPSMTAFYDLNSGSFTTGLFDSYFYSFVNRLPVISAILSFIIVAVNSFLLVELNTRHYFIPGRGLLTALIYALLVSALPQLGVLTPALIAALFFILVLFRVFGTFRQEGLSYNYFEAGILLALAAMFYAPSLLFYPVLLISLVILRPYQWREWAFTAAGMAIPLIFLLSYFYLSDRDPAIVWNNLKESLFIRRKFETGSPFTAYMVYAGLLIVTGSFYISRKIGVMKINARKFFMIFLWIFVFSLLIFLLLPGSGPEIVYFAGIPVSFLISNYFMLCRAKWINNLLFLFFIVVVFLARYF